MSAVLLVFQYGQPRIFFSMSRDGLLPEYFAKVHPKYRTPHVTTLWTGVAQAYAAIANINEIVELTNIGTLFAFVLVCGRFSGKTRIGFEPSKRPGCPSFHFSASGAVST